MVLVPDANVSSDEGQLGGGGAIGDGSVIAVLSYPEADTTASTPTISTYDLNGNLLARATNPPEISFNRKFAISKRFDNTDLMYTITENDTPAQGVIPASTSRMLMATDARTLKTVWTAPLRPQGDESATLRDASNTLYPSQDGHWLLETFSEPATVIDLRTGAERGAPNAVGLLGNSLLVNPNGQATSDLNARLEFRDIATGALTGTTVNPSIVSAAGRFEGIPSNLIASADGSVGLVSDGLTDGLQVFSISASSGAPGWRTRIPTSGTPYLYDDRTSGVAVLSVESGGASYGIDEATGRILWTQEGAHTCGAQDGRVAVIANNQLATLDSKTGQQISFEPDISQCPEIIRGGYAYTPNRGITRYW